MVGVRGVVVVGVKGAARLDSVNGPEVVVGVVVVGVVVVGVNDLDRLVSVGVGVVKLSVVGVCGVVVVVEVVVGGVYSKYE